MTQSRRSGFAALVPVLAPMFASLACIGVHAAPVDVQVRDAAGQPLTDAVVFLESPAARTAVKPAAGIEIAQSKRRFEPAVSVVPLGSAVSFPNRDSVRHHVYSFSPAKPFELKLYAGVPANPVTFDKPGIAVLGCNIHDEMVAWVVVVDSPWYGMSGADGRLRIDAPPGSYRLRAWHVALPTGATPLDQPLDVAAGGGAVGVTVPVGGAAR